MQISIDLFYFILLVIYFILLVNLFTTIKLQNSNKLFKNSNNAQIKYLKKNFKQLRYVKCHILVYLSYKNLFYSRKLWIFF